MSPTFHLVLLIHAHQPLGNFDDVIESAYQRAYLPFIELLGRHPAVRVGLHYSGSLLQWIEQHHPEYFSLLRELGTGNQIELVGGGYYEPILISIPPEDQQAQLTRMAGYIEQHFGDRPEGAWLAERVWEPQLPSILARAGVSYSLVDDTHFLAAGFEPEQLFGSYIAEDAGLTVRLLPGLKSLRYLLPFHPVEEAIAHLRVGATSHPGGMAVMGDDLEKFGVWPGTHKHCYQDGWLESFFSALEANSAWLATTPPGEYLAAHPSLGRADLPTASYSEMMEWALPTPARQRLQAFIRESSSRPEILAFLRGGPWRAFLTKYAESNLLHKKMLHASARLSELRSRKLHRRSAEALERAFDHVLRAQCNDPYWHGIFGGLYASHLRTSSWRDLIRAETLADGAASKDGSPSLARLDYDADGREELLFSAPCYSALLKPSDGATLAAVDFRPAAATLINSVMRRPEAYHARLQEGARATGAVASIHEQTRVKEPGLERYLRYDRWPRHTFRLLLFRSDKTFSDYEAIRLDEDPAFAAGAWEVLAAAEASAELARSGHLASVHPEGLAAPPLRAVKLLSFAPRAQGFEVSCDLTLSHESAHSIHLAVGIESVVNFLAPNDPDRSISTASGRHPLRWSGAAPASPLVFSDGWQKVRVTLEASAASAFWIAPIESVSESEEGFERVYQGSQILAVWPAELSPRLPWHARLVWRVETL
ncbi:MAG: alpha-amylase/4-alpha-glucanotransferase domain-containing protein [Candidatus Acidiferrales bacterium]